MASFRKDKRASTDWLKKPDYHTQRILQAAAQQQEQPQQPSLEKQRLLSNSSFEDLSQILRNPYQMSTSNTTKTVTGHASSPTPIQKQAAGVTVGFGSKSRRPIGQTTIKEIAEYSYIPDVRQLNAISTMQLKEQRTQLVQQMTAARTKSVLSNNNKSQTETTQKLTLSQASQQRITRKPRKKNKAEQHFRGDYEDYSGLEDMQSMGDQSSSALGLMHRMRPQDLNYQQQQLKTIMNRSKSTAAPIMMGHKLYEDAQTPQIHLLHQVESAAELQKRLNSRELKQLIQEGDDQHLEISYEGDLGLSSLPNENSQNIGPKSTHAGSNQTTDLPLLQGGGKGQIPKLKLDQSATMLSNLPKVIAADESQIQIMHNESIETLGTLHEQNQTLPNINTDDILLPALPDEMISNNHGDHGEGNSRLLLNQNSVQQFSTSNLHLVESRRNFQSQHHPTELNHQRRPRGSKQQNKLTKSSTMRKKIKSSFASDLNDQADKKQQNSTFSGVVQTRKLAPQETVQQRIQGAISQQSIQRQRQLDLEESHRTILNKLAGEFIEQLNNDESNQKQQRGYQTMTAPRQSSLPVIATKNSTSVLSSQYLNTSQISCMPRSSFIVNKRKLKNKLRDTREQQKELIKVLKAQNLHNPLEDSSFKFSKESIIVDSGGATKTTENTFSRSIPVLRGLKHQMQPAESMHAQSIIPRKVLQREMSNEKIYTKVSLSTKKQVESSDTERQLLSDYKTQPSLKQMIDSERKLDSEVKEVIPRMNHFPLQGRTIQVEGHDDSKIFSSRKKYKSLKKRFEDSQQSEETSQKQKVAQQWQALHKNDALQKRSAETLQILEKDPLKKHLMNIENQPGVRKHYLDDEIRGVKFRQQVGPASYETYEKQVSLPVKLRTNIAPIVIKREIEKEMRVTSETILDKKQLSRSNDSSLQEIVSLQPSHAAALAAIKQQQQDQQNQTYQREQESGADNNEVQLDQQSVATKDSAELGPDNPAVHQIILPAVQAQQQSNEKDGVAASSHMILNENEEYSEDRPITMRQENKTGKSFQKIKVPLKEAQNQSKSRMANNHYQSHSEERLGSSKDVSSGEQYMNLAEKRSNRRPSDKFSFKSGESNSDIDAVLSQAVKAFQAGVQGTKATAEQLQAPSQAASISQVSINKAAQVILPAPVGKSRHQEPIKYQGHNQNSSSLLLPDAVSYHMAGAIYDSNQSSVKHSHVDTTLNTDISPILFAVHSPEHQTQTRAGLHNQLTGAAKQLNFKPVFQASERSNETLMKSPVRTINTNEHTSFENSEARRESLNIQQNVHVSEHHVADEQEITKPLYTYQVVTEHLNDNETEPPLEIDPNNKDGLQLILAISQRENEKSKATKSSLKDMLKQVQESKKERELKSWTNKQASTKTVGAVIGTVPRFKYSEAEQVVNESLPGPGSYDSVHIKDIQPVRTSPQKPAPSPIATKNFRTSFPPHEPEYASLAPESDKLRLREGSQDQGTQMQPDDQNLASIATKGAKGSKTLKQSQERAKKQQSSQERPNANFISKVPKQSVFTTRQDFTGEVDFNDQSNLTISQAQNQLTLRTVQKMFAGRKEQHTLNVHKLVRINRLKQLNKADPLINNTQPAHREQSNEQSMIYLNEAGEVIKSMQIAASLSAQEITNSNPTQENTEDNMWRAGPKLISGQQDFLHQNAANIAINLNNNTDEVVKYENTLTKNSSAYLVLDPVNEQDHGASRGETDLSASDKFIQVHNGGIIIDQNRQLLYDQKSRANRQSETLESNGGEQLKM